MMDPSIDAANKLTEKIVAALRESHIPVMKIEQATYDTDATITISEKLDVQISLDLSFGLVEERGDKFFFHPVATSIPKLIRSIKNRAK